MKHSVQLSPCDGACTRILHQHYLAQEPYMAQVVGTLKTSASFDTIQHSTVQKKMFFVYLISVSVFNHHALPVCRPWTRDAGRDCGATFYCPVGGHQHVPAVWPPEDHRQAPSKYLNHFLNIAYPLTDDAARRMTDQRQIDLEPCLACVLQSGNEVDVMCS